MLICNVCNQGIALQRTADDAADYQRMAYIRHLMYAHGIQRPEARAIAKNAVLLTLVLPSNQQRDWERARRMWAEGYTIREIAEDYDLTEKGMRTRIRRWRKTRGWFPVRNAA